MRGKAHFGDWNRLVPAPQRSGLNLAERGLIQRSQIIWMKLDVADCSRGYSVCAILGETVPGNRWLFGPDGSPESLLLLIAPSRQKK